MKKIAIIGQPNVGKSSLYNRFLKKMDAIVSEQTGTTRDVKRQMVTFDDKEAILLDTGGLEDKDELFNQIKVKSIDIAKKADLVLFMVDGQKIPDEKDKKLFYELLTLDKRLALVVNKIDNDYMMEQFYNFYKFGVDVMFAVSVSHNRGFVALRNWIKSHLPAPLVTVEASSDEDELFDEVQNEIIEGFSEENNEIKIAIIGRVNVGKSSLLNALVKEDRSIVSPVAGTTIDPVDEMVFYKEKRITFVDTAGIRKRGKVTSIERWALQRTDRQLCEADIALVVLDSSEDFKELDEKIAGLTNKHKLGVVIVLNKWDIRQSSFEEATAMVRTKFKFLEFAPIITLSALTRQRVEKVFDLILSVYRNYTSRISTAKLNEMIKQATIKHPLPSISGRRLKIYYATQFSNKPPQIAVVMNSPKDLHFSYRRYLQNSVREMMPLTGSPLIILPRSRSGKIMTISS